MQTGTEPLQAPGAGTATQPLQAPGTGPEVLPTGNDPAQLDQSLAGGRAVEIEGESESEPELNRKQASPGLMSRVNYLKMLLTWTSLKKPTTERQ